MVLLSGCGSGGRDGVFGARDHGSAVFDSPVPRALCGPGSQPETGNLQGQITAEDRASGRAEEGYWCNLEIIGRQGTASDIQMATFNDCAYYTVDRTGSGVAVVDVTDSTNPVRTATLVSPAMLSPWESLKESEARALLGAVWGSPPVGNGPAFFDLYDLSDDCTQPSLTASVPTNIGVGHEGEFSADGTIYYGTSTIVSGITPIDVTDPAVPLPLQRLNLTSHGLSTNDDGTRAYLANLNGNGLDIVDVSEIQDRMLNPQVFIVSSLYWDDGSAAQATIPVTIGGHPYIIFFDESGYGGVRIIDIADETDPQIVSKIRLEVQMPEVGPMAASEDGEVGVFGYNTHYCGVPQREEPGVVACTGFGTGMRVYDIRDPVHPRELAYYNALTTGGPGQLDSGGVAKPHFRADRGEIWFTLEGSGPNSGLYIARFTNSVWPFGD